jgi:hypothetical protein
VRAPPALRIDLFGPISGIFGGEGSSALMADAGSDGASPGARALAIVPITSQNRTQASKFASTASPGPNPSATQGRGARVRRI